MSDKYIEGAGILLENTDATFVYTEPEEVATQHGPGWNAQIRKVTVPVRAFEETDKGYLLKAQNTPGLVAKFIPSGHLLALYFTSKPEGGGYV